MWCLTAPRVVVHRIRDDKSKDTFKALMDGYKGPSCATRSRPTRPEHVATTPSRSPGVGRIIPRRSLSGAVRVCESSAGFCDSRRKITV